VRTVTTKIKLHHYFMRCVLTSSGKQLPKWGYEQQEISCNPTLRDPNSLWNIEDNFHPKCKFHPIYKYLFKSFNNILDCFSVPNVSFQSFAPGFISRFLESHAVMLQGNAGLKPKEGEYTSRPWEWPINLRVQKVSVVSFLQDQGICCGEPITSTCYLS
jgi:dolichyl-phosphate-mannose-protein mannosyltransferase